MKWKWLAPVLCAALLAGCATSRYRPAEKHLERKEYNQAIRAYLQALDPHLRDGKRYIYYDEEGVTGIGTVYWHMQRFETALKILRLVIEKNPSSGNALFYMGLCHEGLGNETDAIRTYRQYTQLPSGDLFRQVLAGRLDWVVRNKITRDIEMALKREAELEISAYPDKSVAVLSFLSLSDNREWEPLQKGLAEMMITDLSQIQEITVVERLMVDRLLEELRMSTSGLSDPKASLRFGKLVGAKNLIKGSYLVMADQKMTLDAGIFESGKDGGLVNFNLDGNLVRLFQMEKELVLNILTHFGISLTPQDRERLLKIPTEDIDAFMAYCNGLDALDRGDFSTAHRFFQEAVRKDPNFDLARDLTVAPSIWDVTHGQNLYRMQLAVAEWVKTTSAGQSRIALREPPAMTSTYNRLQQMGQRQNAGFLPGPESRTSFEEASTVGMQLLPELLGEPPRPPGSR